MIKLIKAANYSESRVKTAQIDKTSYITTDTMLADKAGISSLGTIPSYGDQIQGYSELDILIGNIRPYLKKIWLADKSGGCSADVLVIKAKDNFDPKFVYYSIFRDDFFKHMMKGSKGTKMPRGDKDQIMEFHIPDFDIKLQTKIGDLLYTIDRKIDTNNTISLKLSNILNTYYEYWFLQFDFPDDNGKPYKSDGGKLVWSDTLKRNIPINWNTSLLSNTLKTELGGTPSTKVKKYWDNGKIPWLSSSETATFPIVESDNYITLDGIESSAASVLPKGSIVVSIVRYIRPSVLAIDASTNQSVVGILETDNLKYQYIYPYIVHEIPRLMRTRGGAQQPHINKESIDEIWLLIPDPKVLNKYYSVVSPMYEELIRISFENKNLIKLRDWLLPLLMNGQITVN